MLLKNTFSSTKKFFKNKIQSFKSLLSGGYERLPKSPPLNPFACGGGNADAKARQSCREFDNFYLDYTSNEPDFAEEKTKMGIKKNDKEDHKKGQQEAYKGNFKNMYSNGMKEIVSSHQGEKIQSHQVREEAQFVVMEKLKELETMDMSNVNHVLDIEEVLHYYSRLTSPAYLEIVDRFFMQMYSEFLNSSTSFRKKNA